MFLTAVAALGCAILLLDAASGRDDLLPRRGARLHAPNGHGMCDVPVRQELRRALSGADEPRGEQRLRRHFRQIGELVQSDELTLLAERVRESTLRHPARQRHLAALEARLPAARTVVAGARLDALVSLAGRLARPRPGAAAETLAVPVRARRGHQIVKSDLAAICIAAGGPFSTLCHCLIPPPASRPPDAGPACSSRERMPSPA